MSQAPCSQKVRGCGAHRLALARPTRGSSPDGARRGAADRREYRQAAGAAGPVTNQGPTGRPRFLQSFRSRVWPGFDITQSVADQYRIPIVAETWRRKRAMSDSQKLRDRAARVLAMALKSRENGLEKHSDELTQLASEMLQHAEEMERRSAHVQDVQASTT